jgi:hypothetical protein
MNTEEFIRAVKTRAVDAAVKSVVTNLEKPPGREPPATLVEDSAWFSQLDETTKTYVLRIASRAADYAMFGFFCIVDGVRVIESGHDKGNLTITYHKGDIHRDLNEPDKVLLHDLYREVQPPF